MTDQGQAERLAGTMSAPSADVAAFLSRVVPFRDLSMTELETLAGAAEELAVPQDDVVLVEDSTPGMRLYLVRSGSLELLHKGGVVEIAAAGDVFGHPTLLTGLPPTFTVRAREDALLYAFPREAVLDLLSRPAGVAFVASSMRQRLKGALRAERAIPEARSVSVASLIRRPPVFCTPDTAIREAARMMSDENVSALLVRLDDGLGIVTNADLRDRVLARGKSAGDPVRSIATRPVRTIRDDRLAPEASVEMMTGGFNHLAVVDAAGEVRGIISAGSMMQLDALSPFAVHWSIASARDQDGVVDVMSHLPRLFLSLLDASVGETDICRVLTVQYDAAAVRLLELAVERHGPAPLPYAWLALGSWARGEVTVASDQENALAYAGQEDPDIDAYFARVARDVNEGLARCGLSRDSDDVLASSRSWRMSQAEWLHVFRDCLESPHRSHLVRAALSFDVREVAGDLGIVSAFAELLQEAPRYPDFLRQLARTITDIRSPLGFRQRLIGPLDIKKSGALPIENIARFHALAHGIVTPATVDRLRAIQEAGVLDPDTATSLLEALGIITRVRLRHHAACLEAGRRPDNVVDSTLLAPLARLDLQAAFRAVAGAQRRLSYVVPLGM